MPAKDLYNAKEERMVYPLKPLVGGSEKGKIAIRCRRATDHDKEFLINYQESSKKKLTTGILKQSEGKTIIGGKHGVGMIRRIFETKVRTVVEDGQTIHKFKVMPRPDPDNATATEWMTHEEIEDAIMQPSRQYQYVGSGKIAKVYLEILACDDLPNMETVGHFGNKTDAFVQIVYEDCICNTNVIENKDSPRFLPWTNRAFVLHTAYPSSVINLGVFDYDPGGAAISDHDFVGRVSVDVTNLCPGTEYQLNYTLYDTALIEKRKSNGTIKASA